MSTVPALGLTYDGQDIQDLEGLFLQIASGLYDGVDVRGEDVTVPYLAGQAVRPRRRHTRKIRLVGFVRGADPAATTEPDRQMDYSVKQRDLDVLFDPARLPAELIVTFPDTSTGTISCRPVSVIHAPLVLEEYTGLDVELVSLDPDWVYFGIGAISVPTAALVATRHAPTVTSSG